MADLSLDLNTSSLTYKDLLFLNQDLVLTNDTPSGLSAGGNNPVLQDILQRLSMFLGEWFMDNTQGTPWFQQILVKSPDLAAIDAIFKNIILSTPGVMQLNGFKFTPNLSARLLSVTFSVLSTSGKINYNGLLSPVFAGAQQQTVGGP
jgi:hypothetical protein